MKFVIFVFHVTFALVLKKNFIHIVLSLLLTIAATDYIWYDLINGDQIEIELEIEKEGESEEELRENRSETKDDLVHGSWMTNSQSFSFQTISSGILSHGNSYRPLADTNGEELIILYCQLRLHC